MKTKNLLMTGILIIGLTRISNAQTLFVPADSVAPGTLTYGFSGGSFQSYGCAGLDPTYWLSGNGDEITINFVNAQTNPSLRVWGMNDDDIAQVFVNAVAYPLTSISASYDAKVICNTTYGSPGPDGVLFSNNLLVGANTNAAGNYSYQNVTLLTSGVNSLKISGIAGAGWGFGGVTVNTVLSDPEQIAGNNLFVAFPNPVSSRLNIKSNIKLIGANYKIFDITGSVVLSGRIVSENTILELSNIPAGLYLISIDENMKQMLQVIKE